MFACAKWKRKGTNRLLNYYRALNKGLFLVQECVQGFLNRILGYEWNLYFNYYFVKKN